MLLVRFGTIMSGSWDCTGKVWVSRKCSMTLTGHSFAVWAVAILPEVGVMVTASADKLVKLWKAGVCTHTLSGHTDCVRSLAVISSEQFLSAGNDATVRRWSRTGDCLGTFYGHENYIYSVALLSSGGSDVSWVTSGEDRSVRVWEGGEVKQTIYLPAISVWSVAVLDSGDIAAATSDGCVRIFTREPARHAAAEVQEVFEAELSKVALAAQQELGGVKLTDLPGPEALYEPGAKDGQQKMVREGDKVSVHSWSMADGKWTKIGDVVGAAGGEQNSGKKLYNGKEYDYVFDIEIDEPKCTLKLPYNLSDSPYMAAQTFIHKHDLSQFYLDEIAQHIVKNTGGQSIGGGTGGNADPLTGGGSYHSEAISGGGAAAGGAYDPFTGGAAYTSGSGGAVTGSQGGPPPEDPWMAGAYRTEDTADKMDTDSGPAVINNKYFPQQGYLYFDSQVKPEPVVKKLKEFNSLVPAEQRLEDSVLDQLPSLTSSPGPDPGLVSALHSVLKWPEAQTFPALDLLRASLLNPGCQPLLTEKTSLDEIFSLCLRHVDKASPPNCQMLSLRCLCNLFSTEAGQGIMRTYRDSVVSRVMEKLFPVADDNKNIQTAAASVMLNYAVSLADRGDDETQVQRAPPF